MPVETLHAPYKVPPMKRCIYWSAQGIHPVELSLLTAPHLGRVVAHVNASAQ